MRALFAIGAAFALAGCVTNAESGPQTSKTMTAGVGDTILRKENREAMPNAFGKPDIFGRTRAAGFSSVQFGGMRGGKVILLRNEVVTQSDATTMNSTALVLPSQARSTTSGTIGNSSVSLDTTARGNVYIPPAGSTSVSSQQPTIPIVVDWKSNPRVPVMGRTIVVEGATPVALSYRIE